MILRTAGQLTVLYSRIAELAGYVGKSVTKHRGRGHLVDNIFAIHILFLFVQELRILSWNFENNFLNFTITSQPHEKSLN